MSDLNMWQGIGRLGKDVEIRVTAGGDSVSLCVVFRLF